MNRKELIAAAIATSGETGATVARVSDALFATITAELKAGREVAVAGFGKFATSKRAARKGRNPFTGEPMKIAARRAPKFVAGKTLKEAVDRRRK